jgi:ferredoxin-NADP reductase
VYICGPDGFTAQIADAARQLGTDPEQIHTETFGF